MNLSVAKMSRLKNTDTAAMLKEATDEINLYRSRLVSLGRIGDIMAKFKNNGKLKPLIIVGSRPKIIQLAINSNYWRTLC